MGEIVYRELAAEEICREFFRGFIRRQEVVKCYRRERGEWVIRDDPFIDDWSEEDYGFLVRCLKNTVHTGGVVYGAFLDGRLKGFASVEAKLFGGEERYLDLSSIHVSADMRGHGIGKKLFIAAKSWAGKHGGKKLYISAHSAVETQAFYKAMGCTEAKVYNTEHVEREPFDCQLECEIIPGQGN
ncbi:MAG: GNAT family N-acetyltransferase [Oscillospiraceae bacterium]|nr:GNAT family N-acetyltransferase [Oscillospiraceae bacterium]